MAFSPRHRVTSSLFVLGAAFLPPLLVTACGAEFKAAATNDKESTAGGAGSDADGGGQDGSGGRQGSQGGAAGRASAGGAPTGGSVGSGGVPGSGGATVSGGAPGTGGTQAAGGAGSGGAPGSGGVQGSGGAQGTGGAILVTCTPGTLECDHVAPRRCTDLGLWKDYKCGPLLLSDLAGIDTQKLPGFNDPGFRCKSLTVCGVSQSCFYSGERLGSVQSAESTYTDGSTLMAAEAVKVVIAGGAASQCGNPEIAVSADETLVIQPASGKHVTIYYPDFKGQTLTLYVREDGATFYDAALTQRAQGPG